MNKIQDCVGEALMELGLSPELKGFHYLGSGVQLLAANSEKYESCLVKALYVDIARLYNTTAPRVERAIRHAIEVAVSRMPSEVWQAWFGNSIDICRAKPTNAQMLYTMTYRLRSQIAV